MMSCFYGSGTFFIFCKLQVSCYAMLLAMAFYKYSFLVLLWLCTARHLVAFHCGIQVFCRSFFFRIAGVQNVLQGKACLQVVHLPTMFYLVQNSSSWHSLLTHSLRRESSVGHMYLWRLAMNTKSHGQGIPRIFQRTREKHLCHITIVISWQGSKQVALPWLHVDCHWA